MSGEPASYIGRFAPSPTGPLHFGSLLTAVASYLQARTNDGKWLVRVEDIDPPREPPGSDIVILRALETYGFEWNGPITYQSAFRDRHEDLLHSLLSRDLAYPCSCSRRDLADVDRGPLGTIYPGTCRSGCDGKEVAYRLRTTNAPIEFTDILQGLQSQRLESESGDFIIKRRDGLIAYHLAVVADDHDQRISEIVRGVDLLDSTQRHIHLQNCLEFPTPAYMHVPVVENADGQKLSKLTGAAAISEADIQATLFTALVALRQEPPNDLATADLRSIWDWAEANWRPKRLAGQKSIPIDQYTLAE
jgi:glutamyl-Q tRNA(Asp) synthetase